MATQDERVDFADLDPATAAVRDLVAESRELVGRMAQVMDMNANDMSALGALTQNGPMGVVELADHLGIRSASATAMVDRLEHAGHVERLRDTVDRRRVTVTATPSAQQAAYLAWGPLIGEMDEIARSLSTEERDIVCRFLDKMIEVTRRGGREQPQPK
jgi:DNA-binding MarR family transcriptional regulator